MTVLVRLFVVLMLACAVLHVCTFYWLRAGERDRLEADWERDRPAVARETHLELGLRRWSRRTRRWLPWATFGAPTAVTVALVWALNYA